jgi:cell division protease FtsH
MLAGRAAEKLIFDEYSAGAENDLKQATRMARNMVAHWGMSDKVGPVAFRQGEEHPFLGKEIHENREFSEETAHLIDEEIGRFLRNAQTHAMDVLTHHRDLLEKLTAALLDRETLNQDELIELLGPPVRRPDDDEPAVSEGMSTADEATMRAGRKLSGQAPAGESIPDTGASSS